MSPCFHKQIFTSNKICVIIINTSFTLFFLIFPHCLTAPIVMLQYINKINLLFSQFTPIYPHPFSQNAKIQKTLSPTEREKEERQEKEKADDKTMDEDQEENQDNQYIMKCEMNRNLLQSIFFANGSSKIRVTSCHYLSDNLKRKTNQEDDNQEEKKEDK